MQIPQSRAEAAGAKPLKFRQTLTELMARFANQGGHAGLTAWHLARTANRLDEGTHGLLNQTLAVLSDTIRSGPVTHSGSQLDGGPVFAYDGRKRLVVMSSELWREFRH